MITSGKKAPTRCTIYVAEEYKGWQKTILIKLKELYNESDNSFPPNDVIFHTMKTIDELAPHAKKIMPFVQITKENVSAHKVDALGITLPFSEKAVRMDNMKYLANTLEVGMF